MKKDTSWEKVGTWYDRIVGKKGSYYHTSLIFPNSLRLLDLKAGDSLLDLGCGNGAFARHLPKKVSYVGLDAAKELIKRAKSSSKHPFLVQDVTKSFSLKKSFTAVTFILSLQNMCDLDGAFTAAKKHLEPGGKLLLVLNHPYFRIPRHSGWVVDEKNKLQSRRVDRYMERLEIPITMHPSQKDSPVTYSFHRTLQDHVKALRKQGFCVVDIEEWTSDKKSAGRLAKMEDRARKNFPLFLAILCEKSPIVQEVSTPKK